MLVKLTSRNRLTLPKAVLPALGGAEYLEVVEENGRIVLTPAPANRACAMRVESRRRRPSPRRNAVRTSGADAVRAKLAELGPTETDVADAVAWARSGS